MYTVALSAQAILALTLIVIVSLIVINVVVLGGVFIIDLVIGLIQRIKRGVRK